MSRRRPGTYRIHTGRSTRLQPSDRRFPAGIHGWDCNSHDRVYLAVPFSDNAIVKGAGAKFDPIRKQWFISPTHAHTPPFHLYLSP